MSTNDPSLSGSLASQGRDLRQAEAHYRQLLAEQPGRADVWHRLGGVLHAAGRTGEAATCFERALALDPTHAAACLNLADALLDLGDHDRALATYRRALSLLTPFPEAHHNLAAALLHLGDAAGAIQECQQALAARPGYALALNTLGVALAEVGRIDEAVVALQQAVHCRPHYANAYHNLGNVLEKAGRLEEARQAFRAALAIQPALEEAHYNLAALGDLPPPPGTPRSYLMRLFDSYAASFDRHLVETLSYQVPEMLHEAVLACSGPVAGLDVIDLGCGTGLVGLRFRGVGGRLVGVDVSPGMLRQAGRRQVYDQLVLDDLVHYLHARREPCDVVLAADVFIYLGELTAVFQSVARLLRVGGLFAFSLESTTTADYLLQRNHRYAQSSAYIQRLAGQHGLATALDRPVALRRDGSADAEGRIVVLRTEVNPQDFA
jgi:predicted TPR repeat methyltransferase